MEQKTNAIEITQSLTVTGVAILFAVLRVGNASTLNGYKITVKLLFKSYFMTVVVLFSTQARHRAMYARVDVVYESG